MNDRSLAVHGNLALKAEVIAPAELAPALTVVRGGRDADPAPLRRLSAPRPRALGFTGALLVVAVSLAVGAGVLSARADARGRAVEAATRMEIEVQPGDSLWAIAEEHPIEGLTTSDTVEVLRSWNDLDTAGLVPGAVLLVARG